MSDIKPEFLERLINFNIFLLASSFLLFLNFYTELFHHFSILDIKSMEDWNSKGIDKIVWIKIFIFYCFFMTAIMSVIRYFINPSRKSTTPKEDNPFKVHIDEIDRLSIKFNNLPLHKKYKEHNDEFNRYQQKKYLSQAVFCLFAINFSSTTFKNVVYSILDFNFSNFNLLDLLYLVISSGVAAFIWKVGNSNFNHLLYVEKTLIQPFLDEEAEQNKLKNEANHYEF